jgi:Ca-activated chloride channel family protein
MTVSLDVSTDRTLIRAGARSTRFVLARVTAPLAAARRDRIPVNVAFVLDRSGSMADERKFTLAHEAVEQALRMLRPEDRFALVVYDTRIDVLARSTQATPGAKAAALEALSLIGPRGGTDLGAGWLRGCEAVAEHVDREGVTRCILLSDGLANHGITSRDELAMHAGELRRRGVVTTTMGVGADFDEHLLRDMAHEGGGNFHFIEGASQIPGIMTGELGEALEVTLRDASLYVTLPEGARAEPLNRYRHQRVPGTNELRIELGDLVSEQEIAAVIEINFPRGAIGDSTAISVELRAGERESVSERELRWTYESHEENDTQRRNVEVDRAVASLYAARARAEATEANRHRDARRARRVLERTAERIRSYAFEDRELLHTAQALREDVERYAEREMSGMELKMAFAEADYRVRDRMPSGMARRKV